jgi:hypothetical protein
VARFLLDLRRQEPVIPACWGMTEELSLPAASAQFASEASRGYSLQLLWLRAAARVLSDKLDTFRLTGFRPSNVSPINR